MMQNSFKNLAKNIYGYYQQNNNDQKDNIVFKKELFDIELGSLKYRFDFFDDSDRVPLFVSMDTYPVIQFILSKDSHLLENIAFDILQSIELSLTQMLFIDAFSFGERFSYLSDLDKKVKGSKILTESSEIEANLLKFKEDSISLVQDRLKHNYKTLREYNKEAGLLGEPYRFVFISNFPSGFSQKSIEILSSLMQSAKKTGIYFFISIDYQVISEDKRLHEFLSYPTVDAKSKEILNFSNSSFLQEQFNIALKEDINPKYSQILEDINAKLQKLESQKVDISDQFSSLFVQNTIDSIRIPIGVLGKDNIQYFELGDNVHHGFIGGETGSGKTVLLHNIITYGAYLHSEDELEFYLLDYKGTEFKVYENLPHMRVLSINSEKAFGLSVLVNIQEELERRSDLFNSINVSNITEYRKKSDKPLARLLIIIDEFQVLLNGKDSLSRRVTKILEDITARGRSFGLHLILSTQTLSAVDLGSSLSNIGLRIGLSMNESDSIKIFHRENSVCATIRKAGGAYYNDYKGQSEGNKKFQVSYIDSDEIRVKLQKIREKSGVSKRKQYIFDGLGYADFDNSHIKQMIEGGYFQKNSNFADLIIAEPAFIDHNPIWYRVRKQFGSNVMIVGDEVYDALSILALSLYQFLQISDKNSIVYLFDLFAVDSPFYGKLAEILSQFRDQIKVIKPRKIEESLVEISDILEKRLDDEEITKQKISVVFLNIQSARRLKKEGFSAPKGAKDLINIIKEGPEVGMHTWIFNQSYNGLNSIFDGDIFNEFETKIILQGKDSYKLLPLDMQEKVKHKGIARVYSPFTKFDIDSCKLYNFTDVKRYMEGQK